jgi:hypothetical protein
MMCTCSHDRTVQSRRARPFRLGLVAFLVLGGFATSVQASRVRQLNIEQITQKAARIVSGRCVDLRVERDPGLGVTITRVTLEVEQALKGPAASRLEFHMLGDGRRPATFGVVGGSRFAPGDDVVVFLYGESAVGLSSPVGLGQGKFTKSRLRKDGRPLMRNGFGNRTLFEDLSPRAQQRIGRTAADWADEPGLPLEVLVELVRALDTPRQRVRR